jgi:hypothetical protein
VSAPCLIFKPDVKLVIFKPIKTVRDGKNTFAACIKEDGDRIVVLFGRKSSIHRCTPIDGVAAINLQWPCEKFEFLWRMSSNRRSRP